MGWCTRTATALAACSPYRAAAVRQRQRQQQQQLCIPAMLQQWQAPNAQTAYRLPFAMAPCAACKDSSDDCSCLEWWRPLTDGSAPVDRLGVSWRRLLGRQVDNAASHMSATAEGEGAINRRVCGGEDRAGWDGAVRPEPQQLHPAAAGRRAAPPGTHRRALVCQRSRRRPLPQTPPLRSGCSGWRGSGSW